MRSIHFGFMQILILTAITFLITTSCDLNDPKKDNPKPEGYQEDIPWPSLADVPWPMHHGGPQFTGRSKEAGPQFGIVEWKIEIPTTSPTESILSPIIGKNGTIYFVSFYDTISPGSFLYAVTPKGNIKWKYPLSTNKNTSPPIISAKGDIYLADWANNVSCVDTNGNLKWKITLPRSITSVMNIDKEGNIYGIALDGILYSINPSGNIRWQLKISERGATSDAIVFSPDGSTLYVKNHNNGLYAVTISGEIKWKSSETWLGNDLLSPSITSQGKIFLFYGTIPVNTNRMIDSVLMKKVFNSLHQLPVEVETTIDKFGNFYVAGHNSFFAFDYNGNVRWKKENLIITDGFGLLSDALGKIYLMDQENNLICMNSEGMEIWRLKLDAESYFSPAIHDGRLYLGTVNVNNSFGQLDKKYFYSIK